MKLIPILFQGAMVRALLNDEKTETRRISGRWDNVNAGDYLWVRETFCKGQVDGVFGQIYFYQADNKNMRVPRWSPSLHMPKEACRIFLQVQEIKQQRLLDITEGEAIAEGIMAFTKDNKLFKYGLPDGVWSDMKYSAYDAYMKLWDDINGKDSHLTNPEVWVIKFAKVPKLKVLQEGLL